MDNNQKTLEKHLDSYLQQYHTDQNDREWVAEITQEEIQMYEYFSKQDNN
jgi:GTPase Era involved in 16S rRNA processing